MLINKWKKNQDLLLLFLIVFVGVALRVVAIGVLNHMPVSDELAYLNMARNLVSGNLIEDGLGNYAMYNVGYPLFVLAPVFYIFGENLVFAQSLNIILGGATIVLCYFVAKESGAGRVGGYIAAIIWSLYVPASVYGVYLAKENLMNPLILGVVWCSLRLLKRPSGKLAVVCGGVFGLLVLTGSSALSLAGVVVVVVIFSRGSIFSRAVVGFVFLGCAFLVCVPWAVRNLNVIGAPVLNTNGGFNFYLGNNPAATGWFVSISNTPRGSTWEDLRKVGEVYASDTLKQDAIYWIKNHPSDFVGLALKKAVYFWVPPFHGGEGEGSFVEKFVRFIWLIQYLLIFVAAIMSLFISKLRTRRVAVLFGVVFCYAAVHMLFYIIFRYREPIMPVLGVLAALSIESLINRTRWGVLIKDFDRWAFQERDIK